MPDETKEAYASSRAQGAVGQAQERLLAAALSARLTGIGEGQGIASPLYRGPPVRSGSSSVSGKALEMQR